MAGDFIFNFFIVIIAVKFVKVLFSFVWCSVGSVAELIGVTEFLNGKFIFYKLRFSSGINFSN